MDQNLSLHREADSEETCVRGSLAGVVNPEGGRSVFFGEVERYPLISREHRNGDVTRKFQLPAR